MAARGVLRGPPAEQSEAVVHLAELVRLPKPHPALILVSVLGLEGAVMTDRPSAEGCPEVGCNGADQITMADVDVSAPCVVAADTPYDYVMTAGSFNGGARDSKNRPQFR